MCGNVCLRACVCVCMAVCVCVCVCLSPASFFSLTNSISFLQDKMEEAVGVTVEISTKTRDFTIGLLECCLPKLYEYFPALPRHYPLGSIVKSNSTDSALIESFVCHESWLELSAAQTVGFYIKALRCPKL